MRNTIVATSVALLMTAGLVGCKTAPKMPWAKTAEKSDVESTALAGSAPQLPADIAKEAEGLATASPSIEMSAPAAQVAGGQAAPYSAAPAFTPTPPQVVAAPVHSQGSGAKTTPMVTPTSPYPSTGAPTVATTTAPMTPTVSPTPRSFDNSADLGTVEMPYNPNAVPPAKTVASAAPITPAASNDRYGNSSLSNTTPRYPSTSAPTANIPAVSPSTGGDRYGNIQAAVPAPPISSAPAPSVNLASTATTPPQTTSAPPAYSPASTNPASTNIAAPVTNVAGDRYATTSAIATVAPSTTTSSTTTPSLTTPRVEAPVEVAASAPSYRPGGTSSYESTASASPAVEVATRPKIETTVPNLAVPPSPTTAPAGAPRYR